MGELLLILFIIFFVIPVVRVALTIRRMRKQARRAYEEAFRRASGGATTGGGQSERRSGWAPKPGRKKKIDASVGEYVVFEEVAAERETVVATDNVSESQITDADWEDVK